MLALIRSPRRRLRLRYLAGINLAEVHLPIGVPGRQYAVRPLGKGLAAHGADPSFQLVDHGGAKRLAPVSRGEQVDVPVDLLRRRAIQDVNTPLAVCKG